MSRSSELHPDVRAFLDQIDGLGILPFRKHGVVGARELLERVRPKVAEPAVGAVDERTVPGYDPGTGDLRGAFD